MNLRQKITLSLLLYITLCSIAFAQTVDIPDPNLRAAVRKALNLEHGVPLTQATMQRLIELDARNSQIQHLTGLEYARNLSTLILVYNNISELTSLAELRLKELRLWRNSVIDLSPLANMTTLTLLDLGYNQISDISALGNLTQLTWLELPGNQISNLAPLSNLTQLTLLDLHNNLIADVGPLASLTKLEWLAIEHNKILDHSLFDALPLSHFTYDQTCELPPIPIQPRLENRTFPSIFSAWGGLGWSSVLNQPHLSDIEQMSQHDLYFCCLIFDQFFLIQDIVGKCGATLRAPKKSEMIILRLIRI